MSKLKVAVIVGTRPEAIKLAPVIRGLQDHGSLRPVVLATGQHRELLDQVLSFFQISPDRDLDLMQPDQDPTELAARALCRVGQVLDEVRPVLLLVQGDTTSAMAGALAAAYKHIAVGHVEAGLRSGDRENPFPEETNRILITHVASLHFAPTDTSRTNLLAEGIADESIIVTGNTGIDSLLYTAARAGTEAVEELLPGFAASGRRLVLVTMHRRESFGAPLMGLLATIRTLIEAFPDIEIAYPVHPNPSVKGPAESVLGSVERVRLLEPLDYPHFVSLMKHAQLILTDSGGVQEEAPSLNVPVLVLRDETERPEVVQAGAARLVGRDPDTLFRHAFELLTDANAHGAMTGLPNPYGDGRAAQRVVEACARFLEA